VRHRPQPSPGLYGIIAIYLQSYVKETLDHTTVVTTYGTEIRRAVARHNDSVLPAAVRRA
jgi:hypothetical protein